MSNRVGRVVLPEGAFAYDKAFAMAVRVLMEIPPVRVGVPVMERAEIAPNFSFGVGIDVGRELWIHEGVEAKEVAR